MVHARCFFLIKITAGRPTSTPGLIVVIPFVFVSQEGESTDQEEDESSDESEESDDSNQSNQVWARCMKSRLSKQTNKQTTTATPTRY